MISIEVEAGAGAEIDGTAIEIMTTSIVMCIQKAIVEGVMATIVIDGER